MSQTRGGRRDTDTTPKEERNKSGPGTQKTKECGASTPSAPQEGTQMINQGNTLEEERTWNMEIIGEVDRNNEDIDNISMTRDEEETRQNIREERDRETNTDLNDLVLINKIYRKYVRNPKEPEVGEKK